MEELRLPDAQSADMTEADVLGLMLSEHFQWNGVAILETAAWALEDANYHRECAVVLGLVGVAKQTRKQKGN
jgi:hypothetical protein